MDISEPRRTRDANAVSASRQAGVLFLMSAGLAVAGMPTAPDRVGVLWLIAAADAVVAALAFMLPWNRWGVLSTAALAVPGWLVMGVSTWAFGGFATGTAPFFVLMFAWLGLHQRPRMILAHAPLAAAAYAGALVAAGAPARLVGTTVVMIPVAVAVGLIISSRVRQLQAARQLIEQEERWRTALTATLAHDVRSPLTTIRAAIEIVAEDEGLPDHFQPLLAAANRQTARLTALASNLLDLERVGDGKLRLDLEDVAPAEVGRYVVELLGSCDIKVEIDPGLWIRADRMRLEQMLVNLTTNALRHGRPPVVISAAPVGDTIRISVRDHGSGVPVDEERHLFERLRPTDRHQGSVGPGLWIVKVLAEAHGGRVDYRTADPGAEFAIELPVTAPVGR